MIKNSFNNPIGVFDSGVGGIAVLKELKKALPNENYIYFGDNKNVPYGNKSKDELLFLVERTLKELLNYDVKAIVLGCNTLSVTLFDEISSLVKIPLFGVFPPVNKDKKSILLATNRTSKYFFNSKNLTVYPCKGLALEIEKNIFSLDKIDLKKHIEIDEPFDEIVLGCTHYGFIKEEIEKYFNAKSCSGISYTSNLVKSYLEENSLLSKCFCPEIFFLGDSYLKNMQVYHKYKN
ncbi:MAG: hypothetical protein E7342_03495 [Clostridiales bacterium]|nr:hypothetical protein [Clostridiales bacterium]